LHFIQEWFVQTNKRAMQQARSVLKSRSTIFLYPEHTSSWTVCFMAIVVFRLLALCIVMTSVVTWLITIETRLIVRPKAEENRIVLLTHSGVINWFFVCSMNQSLKSALFITIKSDLSQYENDLTACTNIIIIRIWFISKLWDYKWLVYFVSIPN
jgi:hypothetical protein